MSANRWSSRDSPALSPIAACRVAPFKPQNMSNNAAVTTDGGEIGRAQALQARAARLTPSVDMNPVLLKPQGASGAQIVVQGHVVGQAKARDYQDWKPRLMPQVMRELHAAQADSDLVLVEGAGSAAEINLRANDIANMGFAREANAPVVLVGDIDRGGVIAQLVGCKAVLDRRRRRADRGLHRQQISWRPSLFDDGMRFIAERTGWRALGLVPFSRRRRTSAGGGRLRPARAAPCKRRWRRRSPCRCCRISPISTISIR